MSKDPKQTPPAKVETLEELVYKTSLISGNEHIRRGNPMITVPLTILMYGTFGWSALYMAARTETGKKALKTVGVDLSEQAPEAPPPPPPPPPPPAAAASAPTKQEEPVEPVDPRNEIVPETPKEMPKEDRSASGGGAAGGVPGGVVGGVVGGVAGGVVGGVVGGTGKVVDFDFSNVHVKFQPPAPAYPPLAKIARIQGTVVVEITIGPDGVPTQAKAIEGPIQLRAVSEEYGMKWRFDPALLNGVPQYARFKLNMPYRLR